MPKPRTVALVGATATGKTAVGEALAAALGGEVVCADSRQVFRELEIGTGKPDFAERAARPHHLFDALGLGERPSAGWYGRVAQATLEAIRGRGATPVLVGGSGFWLRAARDGIAGEPPHDTAIRARLRAELEREGAAALHARLASIDPASAARLHPNDGQRIVRALEVWEASGRTLDAWRERAPATPDDAPWAVVELTVAPATLRERIARRTRWMFDSGLAEETRALLDSGLEAPLRALRAVGYDEAMDLVAGRLDRDAAIARTDLRTAQLAKRQRTWFRHQVEATRIDVTDAGPDEATARVRDALETAGG